jgi:hypothetical protein
VLPKVRDSELALLELRLQMQRDLKEPYSLTNELLFIEEMYTKFKTPPRQIAQDLRIASGKRGETEVNLRLKLLAFLRELMAIPEEPLKLRFFDQRNVKLQHVKDLYARYEPLLEKDAIAARRLLENWLLAIHVGLTAVHKLRQVDQDFDGDYMLPQLKGDDGLGKFADSLVLGGQTNGDSPSAGVTALLGDTPVASSPSVAGSLLNLLTRSEKRIEVTKPGAKHAVQVDQQDLHAAVQAATFDGVRAKGDDDREENKLDAPSKALKDATVALEKAVLALGRVHDDPEFDKSRHAKVIAALKKHRRQLRSTESSFSDFGVSIE